MRRSLARCSALGAFFVAAAVALGACGGDSVPGNAVAKVRDSSITKADFGHWMLVASRNQQQQGATTGSAVVPVPPDFTACIAAARTANKPVKGQPTPTTAQLKAQCKSQYEALRDQVVQFLIVAKWYVGEAADQGITLSSKTVDAEFQKRKKQSFSKESQYQAFLKSSGMTPADLNLQVRIDLLQTKMREKILKGKDKVTAKGIADYYAKNKAKFAQPERRDLRIVLTKTSARAAAAKAALQSGRGWKSVAKSFSTDQATKKVGGVLLAVTKGSQEKALDAAVFAAARGKLLGPVKTQFGYYVFEVTKITPATQQTQAQAKAAIQQLLSQQQQDKALTAFSTDFQKKWVAKTTCRSGYVTTLCKNAPKAKTTTTGATTPTPTPDATTTG